MLTGRPTRKPPNPSGLCMCGCGKPTPRALKTSGATGLVKGEHVRYLRGHVREVRESAPLPKVPPPPVHWHLLENAPGPDKAAAVPVTAEVLPTRAHHRRPTKRMPVVERGS